MRFSVLGLFNALSPKDRGSHRIATNVRYGPEARQTLDIYAPTKATGPLPVVFFVYGGSWMDGEKGHYAFVGRALASLGYVVVIPDYRLVGAIEYPAFLDDCADAFGFTAGMIGSHGGDPSRIAVMGHSAGAYNALMITLDPRYRERAGALASVRCFVGLSGPYDFYPFDGRITLRTFGGVNDPQSTQPINLVTRASPPMFLGTGDKDTLVYPRNTVALARRLREAGVEVVEKHYEALDHPATVAALGRVFRSRAPVLSDVDAFLARY